MPQPSITAINTLLNYTSQADYHRLSVLQTRLEPNDTSFTSHSLSIVLNILQIAAMFYLLAVTSFFHRPMRRRMLYGHKGHGLIPTGSAPTAALNNPESQGFLRNQVTSHFIQTSDGEKLHSWLIIPIGAYTKYESTLTKSWSADEASEIALQLLRNDPKAVLAVYFHGNGNHLATQWRCEAYRNLTTGSPEHLYVLVFDYRGFGKSTGHPTEDGLVQDGTSVLSWVEKKLSIPRKRILLMGHSLGVAVAVAAVEKVVEQNQYAEFAGIVLCSGFTEMSKIVPYFKLGGVFPILKPLTWHKQGRRWIDEKLLVDRWPTERRLRDLIRRTEVIRLSIVHAIDDDRIPCFMSEILFNNCVAELRQSGAITETDTELGTLGSLREVKLGGKLIRKVTLNNGGHNKYLNTHTVSFEAMRMFKMTGAFD